jgi:small subunit ribosomal protein S6
MERLLGINEDVLRYLTVRVEELDLELSPVLARRDREGGREGRGDREGRPDREPRPERSYDDAAI